MAATTMTSAAMPFSRSGVRMSRSSMAASMPDSRAARQSFSLAARMSACFERRSSAIFFSASFLTPDGMKASFLAASLAFCPFSSSSSNMTLMASTPGSFFRYGTIIQ
jgi:hypothetical protein